MVAAGVAWHYVVGCCHEVQPFNIEAVLVPAPGLSRIGHIACDSCLCGTLCWMFDRNLRMRWPVRRLRCNLWRGADSIKGRLPILKRRRLVRCPLVTHRSVRLEDWRQREMRDGVRRATMREKLGAMKHLLVSSIDRQWFHNTALELLRELDDMHAEELNFFRRSSLTISW